MTLPYRREVPLPAFVSMAGLTGTLALTAGITGGIALKKSKDYRDSPYEEGWESEQTSGRKLALTTDVLWGVAGAAALATLVLVFFTQFKKEEAPDAALMLYPTLQGPGFMLGGTF